jgi:hypothetical protein
MEQGEQTEAQRMIRPLGQVSVKRKARDRALYLKRLYQMLRFDQASASLTVLWLFLNSFAVDCGGENGRRLKCKHAAGRNRHFYAGARIAADAFAFRAHRKQAEGAQLYSFTADQRITDFFERYLEDLLGLGT